MVETALVTLMVEAGMSHRRAVAFERWLDDTTPVGLTGDQVAHYVSKSRTAYLDAYCEASGPDDSHARQMMLTDELYRQRAVVKAQQTP